MVSRVPPQVLLRSCSVPGESVLPVSSHRGRRRRTANRSLAGPECAGVVLHALRLEPRTNRNHRASTSAMPLSGLVPSTTAMWHQAHLQRCSRSPLSTLPWRWRESNPPRRSRRPGGQTPESAAGLLKRLTDLDRLRPNLTRILCLFRVPRVLLVSWTVPVEVDNRAFGERRSGRLPKPVEVVREPLFGRPRSGARTLSMSPTDRCGPSVATLPARWLRGQSEARRASGGGRRCESTRAGRLPAGLGGSPTP